jgi:eukaryotic-like serine/threonine-protein kinase
MADALFVTQPDKAAEWYRKSIELTKQLGPRTEARSELADRNETLASLLDPRSKLAERLHLLQEANLYRQEVAKTEPVAPRALLHLMRSYCRLSEAELAMNRLPEAREHAASSRPFFTEFAVTSPSLVVLRDVGFCYEALGDVQRSVAEDRSSAFVERRTAQAAALEWYRKSAAVWEEWLRRGAATPESEAERRKVDRLLATK